MFVILLIMFLYSISFFRQSQLCIGLVEYQVGYISLQVEQIYFFPPFPSGQL